MKLFTLILCLSFSNLLCSQESMEAEIPYAEIPEYPAGYSAGNVISRMIDGLGFRFYWASKDLNETDLSYRPSEDGKTTLETLEHLHGLSTTILNGCLNQANIRPAEKQEMDYATMREKTLRNLKQASEVCANKSKEEVEELKVVFQRGENVNSFDFWHMINGPITDAIYHSGQIVAFRRASGNPIQSGVNVFMGTVKE